MRGKQGEGSSRMKLPYVIIATFLIFFGLCYYSLSYSWENKDLMSRYEATKNYLKKTNRLKEVCEEKLNTSDMSDKSCQISNRDLHSQVSKSQLEIAAFQFKLKKANQFFVDIKEKLGKLDETSLSGADGDVLESSYNQLVELLETWKVKVAQHEELTQKQDELFKELYAAKEERDSKDKEIEQLKEHITSLNDDVAVHVERKKQSTGQFDAMKTKVYNLEQELLQHEREQAVRGLQAKHTNFGKVSHRQDLNEEHIDVDNGNDARKQLESPLTNAPGVKVVPEQPGNPLTNTLGMNDTKTELVLNKTSQDNDNNTGIHIAPRNITIQDETRTEQLKTEKPSLNDVNSNIEEKRAVHGSKDITHEEVETRDEDEEEEVDGQGDNEEGTDGKGNIDDDDDGEKHEGKHARMW